MIGLCPTTGKVASKSASTSLVARGQREVQVVGFGHAGIPKAKHGPGLVLCHHHWHERLGSEAVITPREIICLRILKVVGAGCHDGPLVNYWSRNHS